MGKTFRAQVVDGKLAFSDPEAFEQFVKSLEGRVVEVSVFRRRSTSQNRYYWSVVLPALAEYFGYELRQMHMTLRERFLFDGAAIRSTATLDSREFGEYLEACRRLAAECGVNIPDPA